MYTYNLHCHTLLSDGVLLPSEVAMRYMEAGYKSIAVTDHADYSNIESAVKGVLEFVRHWPKKGFALKVFSGIELTHLPPGQFAPLVCYCRSRGIQVIIGHGETVCEPVVKGTNRAALEAGIDILAHPGLITADDAKLAKKLGVFLEITSRHGHRQANSYVVRTGKRYGASFVLNNDSHAPEDIISPSALALVGRKAGLGLKDIELSRCQVAAFLKNKERAR